MKTTSEILRGLRDWITYIPNIEPSDDRVKLVDGLRNSVEGLDQAIESARRLFPKRPGHVEYLTKARNAATGASANILADLKTMPPSRSRPLANASTGGVTNLCN